MTLRTYLSARKIYLDEKTECTIGEKVSDAFFKDFNSRPPKIKSTFSTSDGKVPVNDYPENFLIGCADLIDQILNLAV